MIHAAIIIIIFLQLHFQLINGESSLLNKYDNNCYIGVSGVNVSWFYARDYCENEIGTTLASIHSSIDNIYAYSAGIGASQESGVAGWIGLNDISKEEDYFWTDNSTFNNKITFWYNEKSYNTGFRDCVLFSPYWYSYNCTSRLPFFVCNHPS